jgi:hypothetical protein
MKPVVFLNLKENKFYLVEKKEGEILSLRLLTKAGLFTKTKKVQNLRMMKSIHWKELATVHCTKG